MNLYIKLVLICVLGGILALTVKKHSPEIALVITISITISCLMATIEIMTQVKSEYENMEMFSYLPKESFIPLVKCVAISAITQIASAISKDSGQTAVAYVLEFTGSIVLILCMMPLVGALFQLLGGIL